MRPDPESTTQLLALARRGDERARNRLLARYLPPLRRFAHGRLPAGARDLLDTDDLVQTVVIRSLKHIDGFKPRGEGAFLAYLRKILTNQLRDLGRRVARSPARAELSDQEDPALSPVDVVIGREALERYEAALGRLSAKYHQAVVLRLELRFTYLEIAEAMNLPSEGAARMLVTRALMKLTDSMSVLRERAR